MAGKGTLFSGQTNFFSNLFKKSCFGHWNILDFMERFGFVSVLRVAKRILLFIRCMWGVNTHIIGVGFTAFQAVLQHVYPKKYLFAVLFVWLLRTFGGSVPRSTQKKHVKDGMGDFGMPVGRCERDGVIRHGVGDIDCFGFIGSFIGCSRIDAFAFVLSVAVLQPFPASHGSVDFCNFHLRCDVFRQNG